MVQQSILIVDDDEREVNELVDFFGRVLPDVDVRITTSFKEAIKLAETTWYDVILADMRDELSRPKAGFEIVLASKRANPGAQVIVYTGFPTRETTVQCIRAGCYHVIPKGEQEQLLAATRQALDLASQVVDRHSSSERLILAGWHALADATTAQEKGYALENLCSSLFHSVPGWRRVECRVTTKTEEIDLVIVNESPEVFWRRYPSFILVECKYWSAQRAPGRKEFDAFYQKLSRRGIEDCRLGFFVSVNGITSTFEAELDRIADKPITIVSLDREDIWNMVCSENRSDFLIEQIKNRLFA